MPVPSSSSPAARQIASLRQTGLPTIDLPQELADDAAAPLAPLVGRIADHLADGQPVALTTVGLHDCALGQRHVAALLGRIAAAPGVGDRVGGLVLTGGEVAAAVCAALGAETLRLGGELLPGIPWSVVEGGVATGALIATKAGSFGDERALLTALERLTAMPVAS